MVKFLSVHQDLKLKCLLLPHSSVLYVLQLVGRARDSFHTPPIVGAPQTPRLHLSAGARTGASREP